jgi:chemotaxis protein CheD
VANETTTVVDPALAPIHVGLGEVKATGDQESVLACYGLGSCVCVSAYDPGLKIGGMAHVVLPESSIGNCASGSTKFADTAIPYMLNAMFQIGALKSRLVVKITGGAQMIQSPGFEDVGGIGDRNITAVREQFSKLGISIANADTGGNKGRSSWLSVRSGEVKVRSIGEEVRIL